MKRPTAMIPIGRKALNAPLRRNVYKNTSDESRSAINPKGINKLVVGTVFVISLFFGQSLTNVVSSGYSSLSSGVAKLLKTSKPGGKELGEPAVDNLEVLKVETIVEHPISHNIHDLIQIFDQRVMREWSSKFLNGGIGLDDNSLQEDFIRSISEIDSLLPDDNVFKGRIIGRLRKLFDGEQGLALVKYLKGKGGQMLKHIHSGDAIKFGDQQDLIASKQVISAVLSLLIELANNEESDKVTIIINEIWHSNGLKAKFGRDQIVHIKEGVRLISGTFKYVDRDIFINVFESYYDSFFQYVFSGERKGFTEKDSLAISSRILNFIRSLISTEGAIGEEGVRVLAKKLKTWDFINGIPLMKAYSDLVSSERISGNDIRGLLVRILNVLIASCNDQISSDEYQKIVFDLVKYVKHNIHDKDPELASGAEMQIAQLASKNSPSEPFVDYNLATIQGVKVVSTALYAGGKYMISSLVSKQDQTSGQFIGSVLIREGLLTEGLDEWVKLRSEKLSSLVKESLLNKFPTKSGVNPEIVGQNIDVLTSDFVMHLAKYIDGKLNKPGAVFSVDDLILIVKTYFEIDGNIERLSSFGIKFSENDAKNEIAMVRRLLDEFYKYIYSVKVVDSLRVSVAERISKEDSFASLVENSGDIFSGIAGKAMKEMDFSGLIIRFFIHNIKDKAELDLLFGFLRNNEFLVSGDVKYIESISRLVMILKANSNSSEFSKLADEYLNNGIISSASVDIILNLINNVIQSDGFNSEGFITDASNNVDLIKSTLNISGNNASINESTIEEIVNMVLFFREREELIYALEVTNKIFNLTYSADEMARLIDDLALIDREDLIKTFVSNVDLINRTVRGEEVSFEKKFALVYEIYRKVPKGNRLVFLDHVIGFGSGSATEVSKTDILAKLPIIVGEVFDLESDSEVEEWYNLYRKWFASSAESEYLEQFQLIISLIKKFGRAQTLQLISQSQPEIQGILGDNQNLKRTSEIRLMLRILSKGDTAVFRFMIESGNMHKSINIYSQIIDKAQVIQEFIRSNENRLVRVISFIDAYPDSQPGLDQFMQYGADFFDLARDLLRRTNYKEIDFNKEVEARSMSSNTSGDSGTESNGCDIVRMHFDVIKREILRFNGPKGVVEIILKAPGYILNGIINGGKVDRDTVNGAIYDYFGAGKKSNPGEYEQRQSEFSRELWITNLNASCNN